jgi:hypothetical protein
MEEQITTFYTAFKSGAKPVYVLYTDPPDPVLGGFVIRKLDSNQIAIVAWINRAEAEEFRVRHKYERSLVTEMWYADFKRLLSDVAPEDRKLYKLELR